MRLSTALLWFDSSTGVSFDRKLDEAARAYRSKFGRKPNLCYVNPEDLPSSVTAPSGLVVEAERSVLPHHFYVGIRVGGD